MHSGKIPENKVAFVDAACHTRDMNKHLANIGLAASVAIALVTGAIIVGNQASAYECDGGSVTSQPGDTLWSIATTNCTGHTGAAVYAMGELNEVGILQIGEEIILP